MDDLKNERKYKLAVHHVWSLPPYEIEASNGGGLVQYAGGRVVNNINIVIVIV